MKYIVDLYISGKIFKEEVYANNPKQAREIAQNLNKFARVTAINGTLK
jgi:hypothetical protein